MDKKQKLTLTVDSEVIEKAKSIGINISEITEGILRGFSFTPSDLDNKALLDKYLELFETMKPKLKEYHTFVKVGELQNYNDDAFEGTSDLFLNPDGEFFVPYYIDPYSHPDPKQIDPSDFSKPSTILKNFIDSLASSENRKKQITELEMAKRIIEAIANTSSEKVLGTKYPGFSKSKPKTRKKKVVNS